MPQAIVNVMDTLSTGLIFTRAGSNILLAPHMGQGSEEEGKWTWSGPGSFNSDHRELLLSDIQTEQSGNYSINFTNKCGSTFSRVFSIAVHEHIPYYAIELGSGQRIRPETDADGSQLIQVSGDHDDHWVQWKKIYVEENWFYLKNRKTGKYFRPINHEPDSRMRQIPEAEIDEWAQWRIEDTGDGLGHIFNRGSGLKIRIMSVDFSNPYIEQTGAGNAGGWTRWSMVVLDDVEGATNISEDSTFPDHSLLEYSPNPFTDILTLKVHLPESSVVFLEVFNLYGQKVHSVVAGKELEQGVHTFAWSEGNIQHRQPGRDGLYIIRLQAGDRQVSKKVLAY
jgi:hypothetical protein